MPLAVLGNCRHLKRHKTSREEAGQHEPELLDAGIERFISFIHFGTI